MPGKSRERRQRQHRRSVSSHLYKQVCAFCLFVHVLLWSLTAARRYIEFASVGKLVRKCKVFHVKSLNRIQQVIILLVNFTFNTVNSLVCRLLVETSPILSLQPHWESFR